MVLDNVDAYQYFFGQEDLRYGLRENVKGNELAKSPEFSADISLTYETALASGSIFTGIMQYIHRGDLQQRVSNNTIVDAIDKKDVSQIFESINNDSQLTEEQKEILLANLKQDVTEMEEVTKRWQSDMLSDSWWSKNIRPLSLAFLTLALFLYIILDSAIEGFKINEAWIDLLSSLLLLVYGGYYGARAVEKVVHIRSNKQK